MVVFIQMTYIGFDAGPFNLFSDASAPPFGIPFATGVSPATLLAGANFTVPPGTTTVRVMSTGKCTNYKDFFLSLPVFGLDWIFYSQVDVNGTIWTPPSTYPPCGNAGWSVTPNNLSVTFNISDSSDCPPGTCNGTQSGTATAYITVGPADTNLNISITGLAELEDTGYENCEFKLDGVTLVTATSAGGGLRCAMGPVVQTVLVPGPYPLLAGTNHTFEITFTTADPLYHVGAFYTTTLSFT